MPARPWVTTADVKAYTDHKEVQSRDDAKLKVDIFRAEQKVISITHNQFDSEIYTELPQPVKMAVILIAEVYAKNSVERAKQQITSETFDDYSYTAESSVIDINDLDLDDLLRDYVVPVGTGNVVMRLRKL